MKKAIHTSSLVVTFIFLFFGLVSSAQTFEQAQKITSSYNKTYLRELASQSLQKSRAEKKEAVAYAQARNIPISYTTKEGSYVELQYMLKDGTLIYYQTHNANASRATRANHLNSGGSTGLNLDGLDMIAYVWDAGHPRVTHQEFNNRVSINDVLTIQDPDHNHATHVAGTIAASGVAPAAKGMAPQAEVKAYEWTDDLGEATLAALDGMLISNHSYGYGITDTLQHFFGAYKERSRDWDNLLYNAPYYLMVNSAGNDGSKFDRNYDKLSGFGTSKNNLVVANAKAEVDGEGNFINAVIFPTSSQGPTDDFRIKPDITGHGVEVYSTASNSINLYRQMTGTSMAAPNITGTLLLLQQHYNDVNETFMRAATLKGLALHTADDVGAVGPDAISGWGLLNAKKAAETISNNGSGSLIQELIISQGQTITITVEADSINDLMASISWTDYPGVINDGHDSETAALMNDLDIRVQKQDSIYYPWRLTSATSNSNEGDNMKDPYERVDVENASGSYTIVITHKGNLDSGSQAFSLIVTGIKQIPCDLASIPENIEVLDITGSSARILWETAFENTYSLRYREMEDSSWIPIEDLYTNTYQLTNLSPNTEYEFQVGLRCLESDSVFSDIHSFSTGEIVYCNSTSEDQSFDFYISNVNLNSIDNTSHKTNYSDYTNLSTELVAGHTYSISMNSYAPDNYRASYSVWIDYNNDGHFDMQDEQVYAITTQANTETTGSFTVPSDINLGLTRMRITLTAGALPVWPCETFTYGEVEDYSIYLSPAPNFIYENDIWTPSNPSGVSTASDNIHIVNGTATLTDDTEANNIKVMSGAILKVENNLTIHGTLVFKSTAEGNGELAAVPESANITGNVTVERYMSDNRSYRMVSSAVNTSTSIHSNWQEGATSNTDNPNPGFGTHITGSTVDQTNGFDATQTGNPSMFTVDVAAQQFVPVPNTDVDTLEAGNPYLLFVRGDRSIDLGDNEAEGETILRASGTLAHGISIQSYETTDPGQFLMFGNPYQSAVDINSVFAGSININTNNYFVYDPSLGDLGGYATVDLPTGTNAQGSEANQFLQVGQAAQVANLITGNAAVVFHQVDKAPGNYTATNATGNVLSAPNMLTVQLYTTERFNNGGSVHDGFAMIFDENNSNEITPMDALKPWNFAENFGIDHNGTNLSIERRAMPEEGELYPFFSTGYQHTDYTIKIKVDGLDTSFMYLEDYFMGSSTLLESGENSYGFTVDANDPLSIATDRFAIRTEARLDINDNNILAGIRLYPNPLNENTFYINAPNLNGKTVTLSVNDMLGREIYSAEHSFSETSLKVDLSQSLSSGVYIVKLSSNGLERSLRIIKK